jgi:uncharacterized protein
VIKNLLAFFLPNEKKFYRLIEQLSAQARLSAIHLKDFLESPDETKRAEARKAISAARSEAKNLSGEITKELCNTFITPFDREDIEDFSFSLYKITKTILKICDRLDMYPGMKQGDLVRQTDLIIQEANAMEDMVKELTHGHNTDRIIGKIDVLHTLENEGDKVFGELMTSLFKSNVDAKDLILRKDIYDMLEKVIDRYRDAASVALQIVLKHS